MSVITLEVFLLLFHLLIAAAAPFIEIYSFQTEILSAAFRKTVPAVAVCALLSIVVGKSRFYHNSTFKTLFFKLTAYLMGLEYVALVLEIVCITAAAAIELSPAVPAVGL